MERKFNNVVLPYSTMENPLDRYGDDFQQKSKYSRQKMSEGTLDWSTQPKLYKTYPKASIIDLPRPIPLDGKRFYDLLLKRRSIRFFQPKALNLPQLSYLLWCSSGIGRIDHSYEFRTAPSAGALYPIETYLIVHNVEGIPSGVYHYAIQLHKLEKLRAGDFREEIALAALQQEMTAEAPVVFVWTAIFERTKWKYKQRGYRYIYLDAGHIAENLALAAVDLGLGSCQIGAIFDDEFNQNLEINGKDESTIYLSVVGHPNK
jgi:SagB-type dehydrogenase family enzyme